VKAKDNFDRKVRPSTTTPRLPEVPQFYTKEFKNGLKAIGTQSTDEPKTVIYMTIKGGNLVMSGDMRRLASQTSRPP
jgi:hypothetical protein